MPTALGDAGAAKATAGIARQMQNLFAADVVYAAVVRPEINGVLAANGIEGSDVPESVFVPEGTKWLEESGSAPRSAASAAPAAAPPRAYTASGWAVSASTAPNWEKKRRASPPKKRRKSKWKWENQGESTENGVGVTVSVDGKQRWKGSIEEHRCRQNVRAVTIPLTPTPQRRSDAGSKGRNGPRRAGLRKQRSQPTPSSSNRRLGAMRIASLGPAGTFTEDALGETAQDVEFEPLRTATIHDAILAVERQRGRPRPGPRSRTRSRARSAAPSTRLPSRPTVTIVGEHDYAVRAHLIGREPIELGAIEAVLSHQQPLAQCARFLREQLAGVELRSVSSTAAAVRMVAESVRPWAAIGSRAGGRALRLRGPLRGGRRRGRQRHPFVWIAPAGTVGRGGGEAWKTSLSSPSSATTTRAPWSKRCASSPSADQPDPDRVAADAPGSRPLHVLLRPRGSRGRRARRRGDRAAASKAESVRILGSYPVG